MRADAGSPAPRRAGAGPLCAAQEAQWELMCALSPGDPGDARVVVVDSRYVDGPLDRAALEGAFADVTRRHDGLRLHVAAVAPDPLVRVRAEVEAPVELLDLAAVGEARQREAVAALLHAEHRRRFDLRAGPLWHAVVVRLGAERFLLVSCFSHLVADGWACKVFLQDLVAAYAARTGHRVPPGGRAPTLAELRALQGVRLAPRPERLRYWRERLLPLPAPPPAPRPADAGADLLLRHAVDFSFTPATVQELARLAWRARSTPFVVLLAAYHLQLAVATGKERTVVSTATFGRTSTAERGAVFQCVSDPYVSTTLPEATTLRGAVAATHEALVGGAEHLVSYKALARAVHPDFDRSRPWADFNLCDGNLYSGAFEEPELTLAGLRVRGGPARLDEPPRGAPGLALADVGGAAARAWAASCGPNVEIGARRRGGRVLYSRVMHTDAAMRRLAEQYLWVVDTLLHRPEETVGALREEHARRFPGAQNDSAEAS